MKFNLNGFSRRAILLVMGLMLTACAHTNSVQPTLDPSSDPQSIKSMFTVEITPADETGYDITRPLRQIEITNHTEQAQKIVSFAYKVDIGGVCEVEIERWIAPKTTATFLFEGETRTDMDPMARLRFQSEDSAEITEVDWDTEKRQSFMPEKSEREFLINDGYTVLAREEQDGYQFALLPGKEAPFCEITAPYFGGTLEDQLLSDQYRDGDPIFYSFLDLELPLEEKERSYIDTLMQKYGVDYAYQGEYDAAALMRDYQRMESFALSPSKDPDHPYILLYCDPDYYQLTAEQLQEAETQKLDWQQLWPQLQRIREDYHSVHFRGWDEPLSEAQRLQLMALCEEKEIDASFEGDPPRNEIGADKPVIYLYHDTPLDFTLKLGQEPTLSYPVYDQGWSGRVSGDQLILQGRDYPYLYYEAMIPDCFDQTEGFVVAREDTISFSEEKLALLGLNYQESADFITYWLPILSQSPYNKIQFPSAVYADVMPMDCDPQPDTVIRVYMVSEGLEEPIEIEPQVLTPAPERKGFTLVEWGGSRRNPN